MRMVIFVKPFLILMTEINELLLIILLFMFDS